MDEIFAYLKRRSPQAAEKFISASSATLAILGDQPGIGCMRHAEYFTDLPYALRFHPIKGFDRVLVYYMDRPESVDVIRIWDAARGLEALMNPLESPQ